VRGMRKEEDELATEEIAHGDIHSDGAVLRRGVPATRCGARYLPKTEAVAGFLLTNKNGAAGFQGPQFDRLWPSFFTGRIRKRRSASREHSRYFFAVLFVVGLHSLFRVTPRMNHVRPRHVGMVCRLLVLSALVVLCCFTVVTRSVGKMFLDFLVVFCSFFRHFVFSRARGCSPPKTQMATEPPRLNQLSSLSCGGRKTIAPVHDGRMTRRGPARYEARFFVGCG
jgi:hypothetical protein